MPGQSSNPGSLKWWLIAAVLILPLNIGTTNAQQQLPSGVSTDTSAGADDTSSAEAANTESLAQRRLAVSKQRQLLQSRIDSLGEDSRSDGTHDALAWQLEMHKYLELLYTQHGIALEQQAELQEEKAQVQADLDLFRSAGPSEKKPYSFLLVDDLQDELIMEQGHEETVHDEIEASQALLASYRAKHDASETQRRQAQEAFETARDPDEKNSLRTRWEQAKLLSRVTAEAVKVQQLTLETARQKFVVAQLQRQLLEEKVAVMSTDAVFSQDDLTVCYATLERDEREVRKLVDQAQSELPAIEQLWLEAKQLNEQTNGDDEVAAERLAARQLQRELQLENLTLLNQRLATITLTRYAWEKRYRAMNSLIPSSEMHTELADLEGFRQRRRQAQALVEIQIRESRLELASLEDRLQSAKQQNSESAEWLELQVQTLHDLIGSLATGLVRYDGLDRLMQKTAKDLGQRADVAASQDRLSQIQQFARICWNYEIAAVDDRPITVRKLVLGVLMLLGGYFLSKLLSRTLARRIFSGLGMTPGASAAWQTISCYLLLIVFGFLSLEVANVPLTVFAFLGGAVAIGVGFGSQNLMNNFISGLILLAERPVRVGDLVDIDGVNGVVEHIGARSTRVKTGSNLEISVPNSVFLENKVTNWTLSDTRIRISVSVGVAYGSPTRTVTQLLQKSVADNPAVLSAPEPLILFKDFGDDALIFEVHFWVHMRTIMDGERIASEVRHTIDELLAQADITIAYPQRDVHLDTLKPIEVNIRQAADDLSDRLRLRDAA